MLHWMWKDTFARIILRGIPQYYDLMIGNCFAVIAEPEWDMKTHTTTGNRRMWGIWIGDCTLDDIRYFFRNYLDNIFFDDPETGKCMGSANELIDRIEIKWDEFHDRFENETDDGHRYNELDRFWNFLKYGGLSDKGFTIAKVKEFSVDDFGRERKK